MLLLYAKLRYVIAECFEVYTYNGHTWTPFHNQAGLWYVESGMRTQDPIVLRPSRSA